MESQPRRYQSRNAFSGGYRFLADTDHSSTTQHTFSNYPDDDEATHAQIITNRNAQMNYPKYPL